MAIPLRNVARVLRHQRFASSLAQSSLLLVNGGCSSRCSTQRTTPQLRRAQHSLHQTDTEDIYEVEEPELRLEDDGDYDIVLPASDDMSKPLSQRPPTRSVPPNILRPPYAATSMSQKLRVMAESFAPASSRIQLGGEEEQKLRRAARLAERTLAMAGSLISPGRTTDEIDALVHEFIISHDAYPSPLLYKGFPKSCCTSVNNIMVHGIPDSRPLRDGDIVNVDITVYLDGYHGDTSKTFFVGEVDDLGKELVAITEEALQAGIRACAPSRPFKDIGRAIYDVVKGKDFSISPAFTGHGIGSVFHCHPWIIHTPNEEPGVMLAGHCFTIEPCIVRGSNADHMEFEDGWTVSSTNWARSAQAEHMVLITDRGADVLTRPST